MEDNCQNGLSDSFKSKDESSANESRSFIDDKGQLFNVDEFAKKHGLGNLLDDANDTVIWIVRYLYQNH